jgi:hypothetical protein
MKALNVIGAIVVVTAIALAGIAVAAAAASLLLVQSASATDDVMTSTTLGEEAVSTTTTTTTNNISNAVLGSLFFIGESETTSFNQINETYFEISEVGNVTIMPPNATATTINATETINFTVDIQPNGLGLDQGQTLLVTEGDDGAAGEEENATTTFVDISRTNPDGTGNATGVVFFSTNSTGQLAFLNNMIGIAQIEFSPEGSTVRMWEWKGADLPFESGDGGAAAPTTGNNQTLSP